MNKIELTCDTTPGTKKDLTLVCGDQTVTVDIPDEVFYGPDGHMPDPRFILRDVVNYLAPALGKLEVASTYVPPVPETEAPPAPETKDQVSDEPEKDNDFQIPIGFGKASDK